MRILVTGAAGAIGSAIIPAVVEAGHQVTAVDRVSFESGLADRSIVGDLTDMAVVVDALADVDRVVHMGAIPSPNGYPDDVIFSSNTRSTYLILDEAGRAGIDRAIVASSAAAVGIAWGNHDVMPQYLPVDEEHPFVVEDPYSLSKQVAEATGAMVTRRWGIDTMLMRFPFIGAGERLAQHLGQFAADPLGTRREVWGWIHTNDVVRSVLLALEADWHGHHVVNVAATDTGLAEPTADLVARYLPGIAVRGDLEGNVSLYDSSRIRHLIGFVATETWRDR